MRSFLLATLLAVASIPTTARIADACGSYTFEPAALQMHTAVVHADKVRQFVFTGARLTEAQAKKIEFTRVDTMSYDWTATAPAPKLAQPMTFTIVGPAGRKVIRTAQTVWVKMPWGDREIRQAIALPKGDYQVAFAGELDAAWKSFATIHGDSVTSFSADDVMIHAQHGRKAIVNNAEVEGWPVGVVTVAGLRYVALSSFRTTELVRI